MKRIRKYDNLVKPDEVTRLCNQIQFSPELEADREADLAREDGV